jgi:methionyl-tRNA formyltransferase
MIYEDSQRPDSLYEIVGVVTQPPKRRKRMGDVIATPVGEVAKNLGIPVIAPESVRSYI